MFPLLKGWFDFDSNKNRLCPDLINFSLIKIKRYHTLVNLAKIIITVRWNFASLHQDCEK